MLNKCLDVLRLLARVSMPAISLPRVALLQTFEIFKREGELRFLKDKRFWAGSAVMASGVLCSNLNCPALEPQETKAKMSEQIEWSEFR